MKKTAGEADQQGLQWLLDLGPGKTWGLKPKVINILDVQRCFKTRSHLYYHCVVAYGQIQTSKVKLSKLQRMACLRITGAMKTAPTAAIEVLIGLPHCTCSWRLRPEQVFIDSTAVIK
jgi:hypothetical protein